MGTFFATSVEDCGKIAGAIRRAGVCGLDTEFWNCDPTKGSVYGPGRVHIWSLATFAPGPVLHARGYRRAVGCVLPASALEHPGLREALERADVVKAVHNLPVDAHALANHGVTLRGAVNTLNAARWFWPELVPSSGGPGFGLKALKQCLLGKPAGPSFEQVFTVQVERWKEKTKKVRLCSCGTPGCKLRKGHTRYDHVETWHESYLEDYLTPLETVVPGHPLWEAALTYAAEDAVDALELLDLCQVQETTRAMPW